MKREEKLQILNGFQPCLSENVLLPTDTQFTNNQHDLTAALRNQMLKFKFKKKNTLHFFVGVSSQSTPMALRCWARLPQRRSSSWVSAPRAERSSESLQRSSEKPSQRSTRWSRYTSSVRQQTYAPQRINMQTRDYSVCGLLAIFISDVTGELERQQGIQHGIHTNGGQLDAHTGSPSGTVLSHAAHITRHNVPIRHNNAFISHDNAFITRDNA